MNESTDFLSQFLSPAAPIEREISYLGQKGVAYFKRITAGQRAALLKGQRMTRRADEGATMDVDLGESMVTRHKMVQFSCCDANGRPRFKTLGDVQAAPSSLVDVLYDIASDVNSEEEEGESVAGKS
jgi:hypothetical protein